MLARTCHLQHYELIIDMGGESSASSQLPLMRALLPRITLSFRCLLSASCAESAVFASDLTSYDEKLAHRLRDDPETMMPQVSLQTVCCIQRDRAMLLTGNCMH